MARILFVSEYYWPSIGGIEVRAGRYLPAMIERGHVCHVLTSREPSNARPERDERDGVPILRLPFPAALRVGDVAGIASTRRRYATLIAEYRPDLIHVFYGGTLSILLLSEATQGIPVLASFTTWPMLANGAGRSTLERLLRRASWVTTNSARLADLLRETTPSIGSRSSVVYSGNPWPTIEPTALPTNPAIILCIGRLVDWKGFDVMIRAMPEVLRHFPETQLRIVGDGPEMARLRAIAAEENCQDHVTFTGWVHPDRVSQTINECSFVVVPSIGEEPFASVAIQAMQMARPCVVTLSGGMAEAVVPGESGLIVPPGDPAALAEAAISLLANSEKVSAMGHAARERARTMFGWDRYLDEFAGIYRQLAERQRSRKSIA